MNKFRFVIVALAAIFACSCSVLPTKDVGALVFARQSKQKADAVAVRPDLNKEAYRPAAQQVNAWLDAMELKAELAANQWLPVSKIDLGESAIPPGLKATVNRALETLPVREMTAVPKGSADLGRLAAMLLEELRKNARQGRQAEAAALKRMLESYKWQVLL